MKKNFNKILNENVNNINEAPDNYIDYYKSMYNKGYKSPDEKLDDREEQRWQRDFAHRRQEAESKWTDDNKLYARNRAEYLDDLRYKDNRADILHARNRQEKVEDAATLFMRKQQLAQDAHDWYLDKSMFDLKNYTSRKTVDYNDFKNRLYQNEIYRDKDEIRKNNYELRKLDMNNQNKLNMANIKSKDFQFRIQKDYDREIDKQLKNKEIEFNKAQRQLDQLTIKIAQRNKEMQDLINYENANYKKLTKKPTPTEIATYTRQNEQAYQDVLAVLVEDYMEIENYLADPNLTEAQVASKIGNIMSQINYDYRNAMKKFHDKNPMISAWASTNPDVWPTMLTGREFSQVVNGTSYRISKAFNANPTRNTNVHNTLRNAGILFESNLSSIDEQNLIFGSTLDIIHNVISLEEADSAKIISDAGKINLKYAKNEGEKIKAKLEIKKGIRMAEKNQKNKEIHDQISDVIKDPETGVTEAVNVNETDTTYIDNNIARVQAQKKKNNEQVQKKNEQLDKKLETLQSAKARVQSSNINMDESVKDVYTKGLEIDNSEEAASTLDNNNVFSNKKVTELTEKDLRLEKRVSKDLRRDLEHRADRNTDVTADRRTAYIEDQNKRASKEFENMLFNGESGNALKYFINGEINNGNASELNIAKLMENDPNVQIVIKKLKFDLKKVARNTADERVYTDMKIMKTQFRSLFNKSKKEYEDKKYLGR